MKEVYIHVGMPKSGTTTLQKDFFPKIESIYYARSNTELRLFINKILRQNKILFDENLIEYQKELDRILSKITYNKILISSESLIGSYKLNFINMEYNFYCLSKLFPNAKILLTIRKQSNLINSICKQNLHEGHSVKINKFLNYKNENFEEDTEQQFGISLSIYSLNYYEMNKQIKLFFKDNLVLVYEELLQDMSSFLKRITDYMRVDTINDISLSITNKSYSLISSYIAFAFNRFLIKNFNSCGFIPQYPFVDRLKSKNKTFLNKMLIYIFKRFSLRFILQDVLDKVIYIKYSPLDKKKIQQITDAHIESNRKLDEEYNLDLKKYKYY